MEGESIRCATHANSWYDGSGASLARQIDTWVKEANKGHREDTLRGCTARGIIGPHAGLRYCGATAGYAWSYVNPDKVKRVFIIGPSHHHGTSKALLSKASVWECPMGNMKVDRAVVDSLAKQPVFGMMSKSVDEEEHSLEMHQPFIAHAMKGKDFTIVPVMVGQLSEASEAALGQALAPYLADESNFFSISSDFCHWGWRFGYTPYNKGKGEVWQSIEAMDREGMTAIESGSAEKFTSYLEETDNTICGRHAINGMLNGLTECKKQSGKQLQVKFVDYSQSSRNRSMNDSSVSYAGGVLF